MPIVFALALALGPLFFIAPILSGVALAVQVVGGTVVAALKKINRDDLVTLRINMKRVAPPDVRNTADTNTGCILQMASKKFGTMSIIVTFDSTLISERSRKPYGRETLTSAVNCGPTNPDYWLKLEPIIIDEKHDKSYDPDSETLNHWSC